MNLLSFDLRHTFKLNILIFFRRPQQLLRTFEHIRTHHHVRLLPCRCSRTSVPEVHLVEEVPHRSANGTLYFKSLLFVTIYVSI